MKYLLLGLIAIFFIACNNTTNKKDQPLKEKIVEQTPPPVDGEKIYKKNCAICHGAFGDMAANGAKDLTKSTLTLEEKIEIITNGKNVMTPFKTLLKAEEIKAVAEFTESLKGN